MQKLLAGFFLLALVLPPIAEAQSRHPFTGSYDLTRRDEDGELDILQLSDTTIKYEVEAVTHCCGHNIAYDEGIIELKGDDAYDHVGDTECCPLHFHFSNNRVTIIEGSGNCCWGADATTAGIYLKSKRAPDFGKTNESSSYTVTVPRAYFYADSSLTVRKVSYLIAGDTVCNRERSEHAIYVEIYNRKRETLTYGWLSLHDLILKEYRGD